MLFNSWQFAIFFPVVTILYFLLPHKFRWAMLLGASCIFYMVFIPVYILILLVTILIDYFAGIWIEKSVGKAKKKYLIISIISTCSVLFIFKYFNFFNSNFSAIANFLNLKYPIEILNIILPIGLSFHTFQSLSYVIEVYRGRQKAEKHFGIYSLYVMFYPQLVAGPIERPGNLLHQFREKHSFDNTRVTDGLKLMAWGLFKKIVIADRASILVNQIYGNPTGYTGLTLITATVFFAIQIYCDFSGYSDIAIGAAKVMGFKLMDNFKRPYYSRSISEFWKRWHISLSTWFRDYVYISLGGNRVVKWRWQFNLFITFLLSGLWHGANWTYVVWGGLNGLYLIFAIWTKNIRENIANKIGLSKYPILRNSWQIFGTFSLICFAWIFFRAKDLSDAWYVVTHMFIGIEKIIDPRYVMELLGGIGISRIDYMVIILSVAFLEFAYLIQKHFQKKQKSTHISALVRWGIYYILILGIIYFGVFGENNFIYFQF